MRRSLDEIYAAVPSANCKGLCKDSCGPVPVGKRERKRILARHHVEPEAAPGTITCARLVDGRCSIYADRPLICRLFGSVEGMTCPFGCVPDRVLPDEEAHALIDEVGDFRCEF